MFKSLIKSVFPSFATGKFEPDYASFERTRVNAATQEDAVAYVQKQSADVSPNAGAFYDYLFGDTSTLEQQDSLSEFVSAKINDIILNPTELLNDLPVMPTSVAKVISLLGNAEFDLSELIKVIEQEPSMAADMVKLANTSRYKRGDKEVTDLQRAFMYMGADGLKEGVIQVFLKKFSASSNLYFKQFGEKIWSHSFNSAQYAQQLASKVLTKEQANTVYLVALIKNLGTMVIFQLMIEAFKYVDPDAKPCSASFKWLMAEKSSGLTVTIAKHWQLPNQIIELLSIKSSVNDEATCIFDGNFIAESKALFDAKRLIRAEYESKIDTLDSASSKQFALSLLPASHL